MFRSTIFFRRFLPALPLLGLGFSVCAVVLAQGPRERPRYVLQALDLDHDGSLSAQEIQAAPVSLLKLDSNRDGEITADEMEPPRGDAGASPDQLATRLMAFDKNGDGVLTPDELPERMQALFARADTNHDGKLTADEIRQSAAHTGGANGRRGGPGSATGMMRLDPVLAALDVDRDGVLSSAEIHNASAALLTLDVNHDGIVEASEMRVRQQTPEERADHMLEEWDTNRDGRIGKEEAPDGMRDRFTAADTNGDGYLDKEELLEMFKSMPQGGRPGGNSPQGNNGDHPTDQPKGQHD